METTIMGLLGFRLILGLYSLYKMLYPKRRIESYSRMGTIVSPNKTLLISWEGNYEIDWGYVPLKGIRGLYGS